MKKFWEIFGALNKKERVIFFVAAFLIFFSAAGLFLVAIENYTKSVPAGGGSYAEGMAGQPTFINPILASSEMDKSLVRLIFSRLGDLAAKIERENNGPTWKVRLEEGQLWSDQAKLTSDDVLFTVERIQDPDSRSPLFTSWGGVTVTRLSELELRFELTAPYAFFSENLENLYVLPRHLFQNVPTTNWRISDYNLKPVGSGPYEFASYEKRSDGFITTYRLKANQTQERKPLVENFEIKFFSDNAELIAAFNRGQIDGLGGLRSSDLRGISRTYETFSFRLPNYYAAFINQSKNMALKEKGVRRALTLATPKEEIVNSIFDGQAKIQDSPLPGETSSTDRVNLNLAAEILENNGWRLPEVGELGTGLDKETWVREKEIKKSKITLEASLVVPQIPFLEEIAKMLETAWRKIGFKIKVAVLPVQELTGKVIKNRDYEMVLFGNILETNLDLFQFWHSSERFHPGLNLSLYNNPEADRIIEEIRTAEDSAQTKTRLEEVAELIREDYPAVFLFSPDYLYLANKSLRGVNPRLIAEPADRFQNITEWHLKTTRVLK